MAQIEDYCNGATDIFLDLSLKKANELDDEDKKIILYNFFMANWDNMIFKYPRYKELLEKRGYYISNSELDKLIGRFNTQDFLDLQALFNLVWFDPMFLEQEPLAALCRKGRDFTEEDKKLIIEKQLAILTKIIPYYKQKQDEGVIEVATSPFYHPILPLVYNTDIAKISSPDIKLPRSRFSAPADAKKQIESAMKYYEEHFGRAVSGMWPSEGSVSDEVSTLFEGAGIKWIATDENILSRSLQKSIARDIAGNIINPAILYKPYMMQWSSHKLNIVFRDHKLSDLIGFTYSKWQTYDAVHDFIKKLETIRENTTKIPGDYLVTIILDGENAWEYYSNDGRDFLKGIYEYLNNNPNFKCVTVSEYIKEKPVMDVLPDLFPGSWINGNFDIWIGDDEENTAWDYLLRARETLSNYEAGLEDHEKEEKKETLEKAWQEIYAAEGSDWNWWYGDQHSSGYDEIFDFLFRQHITNVYRIIEKQYPKYLEMPIIVPFKSNPPMSMPVDLITPILDGNVTNYYEWLGSGFYDISKIGGTMHQAQSIIRRIYYGFDMNNLYFRFDFDKEIQSPEQIECFTINIDVVFPYEARIKIIPGNDFLVLSGSDYKDKKIGKLAAKKIMELSIPVENLELKPNEELKFIVTVLKGGAEMEHWPIRSPFTLKIPSTDYKLENWYV